MRHSRLLSHLLSVFPPRIKDANGSEDLVQPGFLQNEVAPTVDALGSIRLGETAIENRTGAAGVATTPNTVIPEEDTFRFHFFLQLQHTDTQGRLGGRLQLNNIDGSAMLIASYTGSMADNQMLIVRNIPLPPGYAIQGRFDSVGPAALVALKGLFIDLPLGEMPPIFPGAAMGGGNV